MRRFLPALSLAALLVLALASCGSDKATGLPAGPTEGPETEECDGTVDMNDQLKFVPEKCTVPAGTTVKWVNVGGLPHTVTAEDQKAFDSGNIAGAGEFEFTFRTPGEYPYFCRLHAVAGARAPGSMIGTVVVEGGASSPSP